MGRRPTSDILTARQFACLQGVADHLDSAQIAHRLGISEHTVNGHLHVAMQRLGAGTRRDAVRRYLSIQSKTPERITGQFLVVDGDPVFAAPEASPKVVQEDRFDTSLLTPPAQPEVAQENRFDASLLTPPAHVVLDTKGSRDALTNCLRTLLNIVAIAVGVAVLLIAADPLRESAQRLANDIQPFHRR